MALRGERMATNRLHHGTDQLKARDILELHINTQHIKRSKHIASFCKPSQ
jgi:hypothetical protein